MIYSALIAGFTTTTSLYPITIHRVEANPITVFVGGNHGELHQLSHFSLSSKDGSEDWNTMFSHVLTIGLKGNRTNPQITKIRDQKRVFRSALKKENLNLSQ